MKKSKKQKKDSVSTAANETTGGTGGPKDPWSSNFAVTAVRMTCEQERQWQHALGLLLDEVVREINEGKVRTS
jgi:hypothetical protein